MYYLTRVWYADRLRVDQTFLERSEDSVILPGPEVEVRLKKSIPSLLIVPTYLDRGQTPKDSIPHLIAGSGVAPTTSLGILYSTPLHSVVDISKQSWPSPENHI